MKSARAVLSVGLVGALGVGSLAACGSNSGDAAATDGGTPEGVTLTVTIDAGLDDAARTAFDERAQQFEDANPGITVEPQEFTWDGTTFAAQLAGGTLPDVFPIPFTDGRGLIERKQIADISALVAALPYADDFKANVAQVLATLFVPSVVLLVPLYLTILRPPLLGTSLLNTFWAVWLPAGASAFNVVLVTRFFDNLPREIFEAARMDGAGAFRLFWSIVLPMSKPILGVVSVFAVIAAWKDFLWPMLVLPDPAHQPLSVRLPALADYIELGVFLGALAIATLIPIAIFLLFQKAFLSGAGMDGAVKG